MTCPCRKKLLSALLTIYVRILYHHHLNVLRLSCWLSNSSTKSSKSVFQLVCFQLKVNQCYPIFQWSWNWEMFSLISFSKNLSRVKRWWRDELQLLVTIKHSFSSSCKWNRLQHTDISVENAKEKCCKRKRLHGQDNTSGVYLQKSKFPLQFKSSKWITSHGSDDLGNVKMQPAQEVSSSLVPTQTIWWCCYLQTSSNLFHVPRIWNTTSTRTIAAMRDDGEQILWVNSFQTLHGNNWLD